MFGAIFAIGRGIRALGRLARAVRAVGRAMARAARSIALESKKLGERLFRNPRGGSLQLTVTGSWKTSWRGREISDRVMNAAAIAIDQTLADAVAMAQGQAPVDTGWLRNNITFRPAVRSGDRVVGHFGNIDGPDYALIQELRNNYLRRSADAMYPTLASRIKQNAGL